MSMNQLLAYWTELPDLIRIQQGKPDTLSKHERFVRNMIKKKKKES